MNEKLTVYGENLCCEGGANRVLTERQAFNLDNDAPTINTTFTLAPEEFEAIARELIEQS